jgi:hypothetical protein
VVAEEPLPGADDLHHYTEVRMSKYAIEAEVTIQAQVEPQGYIDEPVFDGLDEFDADSFGSYGNEVEETTRIRFSYETDTASDEVEDEVKDLLDSHLSYEGDDLEWEISNVEILSCEKEEMDLGTAKDILLDFCRQYNGDGANDELIAAITVILANI